MGKRFGWTDDDGLDSKDRIRANDLKEKAKKENQHTKNLRQRVQEDEQTKINHYIVWIFYTSSCIINTLDKF